MLKGVSINLDTKNKIKNILNKKSEEIQKKPVNILYKWDFLLYNI